ncbi:MAG: NAD(P)/FAD-dependent oxidoreductase [Candidatus Omnitrophota bacterium]
MKHYNDIVVGAGASGLTLAYLLALNGRSVLLVEKAPHVGGGLARFQKNGVAFDTGFHFTGGLCGDGLLSEMFKALGIRDEIEPVYLADERSNRYVFEGDHAAYDLPPGVKNFTDKLKSYFPDENNAIDQYFDRARKVYEQNRSLDFRKNLQAPGFTDEDFVSLSQVLDSLFKHPHLKGILSTYAMCYGVRPSEVSFANHCRVAYGLYEGVSRIKDGGDAVIKAFQNQKAYSDIDLRLNSYISSCEDVSENQVGRFILNTGEEVSFDQCTFTIHPKEVVSLLPKSHLSKAFLDRVDSFEPSSGFFSVYGVIEDSAEAFQPGITSLFPVPDVDRMMDPANGGPTALVVLTSEEMFKGKSCKLLTAMELASVEQMEEWKSSSVGQRPDSYRAYKQEREEDIVRRILDFYPQYRDRLKILDTASMLTFRDYLHSYDGTAYGVKQKMGQYNLFGKLPYRNIYVAGQSALLPGLLGAMMSAFIVARSILGKEVYEQFMDTRSRV